MSKTSRAILFITIGTLFSNLLGFSRELILAYKYGASSITDMYLVASIIPGTIFAAFAAALTTTFIPIVSDLGLKNPKKISLFTSNMINILGLLTSIILMIFIIFAEPIVKVFAIGFSGEMLIQTVQLTRFMFPLILPLVFYNILNGYLHINDNFFTSSLIGIPLNFFFILGILLSTPEHLYVMGLGNLMGYLAVVFFLFYSVIKLGFDYTFTFNFKDPKLIKLLALGVPIFIGTSVTQLNTIIDRSIASTLNEGIIAALNYSTRLISFINGIFVVSIVTVLFPKLSKLNNINDMIAFKRILSSSIVMITVLVFPISIGAIVLSEPLVRILFERGAFDSEATKHTAASLRFYAIGIIGIGIRELLTKVFYSIHDTKSPLINAVVAVFLNIVLNLMFVKYLGYIGLPLASSISSIVTVILLVITLRSKIGSFGIKKILIDILKILFSSMLMGISVFCVYKLLNSFFAADYLIIDIFKLLSAITFAAIIYYYFLKLMKINEVKDIIGIIMTKVIKH